MWENDDRFDCQTASSDVYYFAIKVVYNIMFYVSWDIIQMANKIEDYR